MKGSNIINFKDLEISEPIQASLVEMGFLEATPIQQEIIPLVLQKCDCLAQAPTGTGKTAAFAIPLLEMIDVNNPMIQALVLCPTRELALQIEREFEKLSSKMDGVRILSIYGGQNIGRQITGLRQKPQIIVGTTGRIMDHLRQRTLKIHECQTIVLDEADEMLDMGFRHDIDTIMKAMPGHIQTLLFSATISKEIYDISKNYQTEPKMVKTLCGDSGMPEIKQFVSYVKEPTKFSALKQIISDNDYHTVLVFCNTKRKVDALNAKLISENYLSACLHGDLKQRERAKVMNQFREKEINILVATDIAARGIDVSNIEAVFNFDLPRDDEYYIHRIGRTSRAKNVGCSYALALGSETRRISQLERVAKSKMEDLILDGLSTEILKEAEHSTLHSSDNQIRFFINSGLKDGVTKGALLRFICDNTGIIGDNINRIKTLDIFSFFDTDKENLAVVEALNGLEFLGRKVAVEVTHDQGDDKKERSHGTRRQVEHSESRSGSGESRGRSFNQRSSAPKHTDSHASYHQSFKTTTDESSTNPSDKYRNDKAFTPDYPKREYRHDKRVREGDKGQPSSKRFFGTPVSKPLDNGTEPKQKRFYKKDDGKPVGDKTKKFYGTGTKDNGAPKEKRFYGSEKGRSNNQSKNSTKFMGRGKGR